VVEETNTASFTRRAVLTAAAAAGGGLAGGVFISPLDAKVDSDDDVAIIKQLTGKTPVESDRVHLVMPRTFPNGYTVPLSFEIDRPND